MNFATFVILVFAIVALVIIVSRWGPSSTASTTQEQPLSPPVGPPCSNCGQPRGAVDHYCRRCGQALSPPEAQQQGPPDQAPPTT